MEFRTEIEGSIRSHFQIFINTSQHTRSFKKHERRIKDIDIKTPETIRQKIKEYFEQNTDKTECMVKPKDEDMTYYFSRNILT